MVTPAMEAATIGRPNVFLTGKQGSTWRPWVSFSLLFRALVCGISLNSCKAFRGYRQSATPLNLTTLASCNLTAPDRSERNVKFL